MGKKIFSRNIIVVPFILILLLVCTYSAVSKGDTQIIAHRGYSSMAPENTLASFELACKNRAWGVECDIYVTKDNKFVVTHDSTIGRMCGVELDVTKSTLAEIQKYPITGGNRVDKYPDQFTPSLEEYLSLLSQYKQVHPVIEIKHELTEDQCEELIKLSDKYFERDRVYYISCFDNTLLELSHISPDSNFQLLTSNPSKDMMDWCVKNRIDISCNVITLTKEVIDYMHKNGLKVSVWTIDNLKRVNEYILTYGVDYVTSNDVMRLN